MCQDRPGNFCSITGTIARQEKTRRISAESMRGLSATVTTLIFQALGKPATTCIWTQYRLAQIRNHENNLRKAPCSGADENRSARDRGAAGALVLLCQRLARQSQVQGQQYDVRGQVGPHRFGIQ